MQPKRILIQKQQIQEEIPFAREILKTANIMETINTIDRGVYGFTKLGIELMEILEVTLAVLKETSKQLQNIIVSSRGGGFAFNMELLSKDIEFINIFSLYAASVEAFEKCQAITSSFISESLGDETSRGDGTMKYLVANNPDALEGITFKINEVEELVKNIIDYMPRILIKDYQKYLQFYRDHPSPDKKVNSIIKAIDCTKRYFKVMANSLELIVRDSSYELYRKALEEINVNILGKFFESFHYSIQDFSENNQLMNIFIEDIIGNQDYIRAAVKLARDVAGFDFTTWENPKQVNPILFAMGNPGCGKTATAHAIGNYFLDFCKTHGIRSRFVIVRRTDWASSYQNASAKQLIDIFKKNVLDYKGLVGIYWPDIDTAFAARDESGIRNEEKNILGAVFGLFDGTILPKNGQWFMLCDANYLNMDKATISRITQDPYYVKGPETKEDFITLFRDIKLKKHRDFLKVSDEEWVQFGQKCIDFKLSGRSIENMARKALMQIEDFEFPDEYFKADLARKKEIIRQYSRTLNYQDIVKITENYVEFEKEAEEKASRKRFEERVAEITNYLSAERYARQIISSE